MADNGKWFKLWCSAVHDPSLDNLSIADFGRWAKLGAVIKEQGTAGKIIIKHPARMMCAVMQVDSFNDLINCINKLPNINVSSETLESVSYLIEFRNWAKYQDNLSTERVRKFRDKNTQMKHPKKRGEEKRREEKRREEKRVIENTVEEEIISTLNSVCNANYKCSSKRTIELIRTRLKEGFTVDNFKTVIDKKYAEWGQDSKMATFLRPETLFGNKFESYLNQPIVKHMTKSEQAMARYLKREADNEERGSEQDCIEVGSNVS